MLRRRLLFGLAALGLAPTLPMQARGQGTWPRPISCGAQGIAVGDGIRLERGAPTYLEMLSDGRIRRAAAASSASNDRDGLGAAYVTAALVPESEVLEPSLQAEPWTSLRARRAAYSNIEIGLHRYSNGSGVWETAARAKLRLWLATTRVLSEDFEVTLSTSAINRVEQYPLGNAQASMQVGYVIDTTVSNLSLGALLAGGRITVTLRGRASRRVLATWRFRIDVPPARFEQALADFDSLVGQRLSWTGESWGRTFPNGISCVDRISCFFTTAAVDAAGLQDDCWELRTLRAFRDGPMQQRREWRALAEQYLEIAPTIVAAINTRHDAHRVWARTWLFGIMPAAILARFGLSGWAVAHYRRLVVWLDRLRASPETPQARCL